MAAAMNVVEPCSTGLGGDAFALYYEASSQRVHCLMGNGAAPEALSFEHLDSVGIGIKPGQQPMDLHSGLTVTVPGAAMLWSDLVSYTALTLYHCRVTIRLCMCEFIYYM